MLFHLSIDANDPQRVAEVLAEFWGGRAMPFPPVGEGSWVATAGDDRGTMIEVYRRGTEFVESDQPNTTCIGSAEAGSATHMAIATPLSRDEATAVAVRAGWPVRYFKRGGAFGVLEVWIEGWRMLEVLTPQMQEEYLATVTAGHRAGRIPDPSAERSDA